MNQRENEAVKLLVHRFDEQMRSAGFDPYQYAHEIAEVLLKMAQVAWNMHALVLGLDVPTLDVIAEVIVVYRERAKVVAGIKTWRDRAQSDAFVQDFAPVVQADILRLN